MSDHPKTPELITAARFKAATGHDPQADDLDLCNCPQAGQPLHWGCGWDAEHQMPRWMVPVGVDPGPFVLTADVIRAVYRHAVEVHPLPTAADDQITWLVAQGMVVATFAADVAEILAALPLDRETLAEVKRRTAAEVVQRLLGVDLDVADMAMDVALRAQHNMPAEGKPH